MVVIAAQIAPQRSTQYAELASTLAPQEWALSPLAAHIETLEPIELGGQAFLRIQLDLSLEQLPYALLDTLATTSAHFLYYDQIGTEDGPFLKPLGAVTEPPFPPDLISTRRYRGKTNELLTHMMCNVAKYSSDFADLDWREITLLDPLAGGGTTLFAGLILGADVIGVEQEKQVVEGTAAFLKQYMRNLGIRAKVREERLKTIGRRWYFTLKEKTKCGFCLGDTTDVRGFMNGFSRPHLIVTDLPYGIQHRGDWEQLLATALPAWAKVLHSGGVLVFSWDATRFPREEMLAVVQQVETLTIFDTPPYTQLAHRVDRVIKQRDVLVAKVAE